MDKRSKDARFDRLREHGCVCCLMNPSLGFQYTGFGIPEIHHLNEGGLHGGKRRGDEYTIPLCAYHHRGKINHHHPLIGPMSSIEEVRRLFGPSWAHGSQIFRDTYPHDDELLALID